MNEPKDRRDDWRHGVDENLASLNAGQRVWEHDLKAIRRDIAAIDRLLRGDTDKETDGLISRLHHQEVEINRLRAVLDPDKAGNKGVVGRLENLENEEKQTIERWKFWVAFVGLLGAILVALITNLDKIEGFLKSQKIDILEAKINNAKNPRPIHRHYTVKVVRPTEKEEIADTP